MGISIGGGLGPFRARVGTRGISGGLGPVSAGTSWRGGRRSSNVDGAGCAGLIAIAVGVAAVFYAVAWPYYLGRWATTKFGAEPGGRTGEVVGWVFECLWLGLLLLVALAAIWSSVEDQRQAKEGAEAEANAERQAAARQQQQAVNAAVLARHRARLEGALETQRHLSGILQAYQQVANAVRAGRDTQVLAAFDEVALTAPRVRGGLTQRVSLDVGRLEVDRTEIRFAGRQRHDRWPTKRIERCIVEADDKASVLIVVSNRKTISGIRQEDLAELIYTTIQAARGSVSIADLANFTFGGIARLESARAEAAARVEAEKRGLSQAQCQAATTNHLDVRAAATTPPKPSQGPAVSGPATQPSSTARTAESAASRTSIGHVGAVDDNDAELVVGTGLAKKSKRVLSDLAAVLEPGERPIGVFSAVRVTPSVDLLVVTDRRILGVARRQLAATGKVAVAVSRTDIVEVTTNWSDVLVAHTPRGKTKVAALTKARDVPAVLDLFNRAASV